MSLSKKSLKKIIPALKTQLTYSQIEYLLSTHYEQELEKKVSQLFQEMEDQILENLQEYYNSDIMFKAHIDLILAPIHELHKKYYETLIQYKIREFDKSRAAGKRIVERKIKFKRKGNIINQQFTVLKADISLNDMVSSTISKDKLFGTSPLAHENLRQRTYKLSEKTLSRVDEDINDIITTGYDGGMGINSVSRDVTRRFGQLKSWEAKRIARTEIHNSHSLGVIQGYEDMGVQYIQWDCSIDGRQRDSHEALDGEIIPLGGVFSNGLRYPGDMNGPASEVINCRCQAVPFIIPYGYIAPPGMSRFREGDLVATLDVFNKDALIERAMQGVNQIPDEILSDAQIMEKLTKMSLEDKFDELDQILDDGALRNWVKLVEKLESIDSRIVRITSKGGNVPPGMQKARDELLKEIFGYEKAIFRKPQPIPDIDFTKFVMDNQEVGEAHSIVDTILEKKQIELQEKILMSADEYTAIHSYGGVEHFRINGYIRQNQDWRDYVASAMDIGRTKEQIIRETEQIIRDIDAGIAKTPGLAQDTTMFRACDTFEGNLRVGDVSSFKGYGSCAFQEESAKGFIDYDELGKPDRYLLKIYAPEGQKGVAMNAKNAGQKFTTYTHEHEYLLPKNQEFQVLEVDHVNKTATILLI